MSIAIIIPVCNAAPLLRQTLMALRRSDRLPDELIVVDDASTDNSAGVALELGAHVLKMQTNSGPAACRNLAVLHTKSDILVFLDADTCVHNDTVSRMEAFLYADPSLSAIIGAYDDAPSDSGLCSQYRNLAHCYIHRSSQWKALTFWSGCGAVRRSVFLEVGGFNESYSKPGIEDIELGYRITDSGCRILLEPSVMVTHTKRWTIPSVVSTDIRNRGIPWMLLLLHRGSMPNDLNLKLRYRFATVFAFLSVVFAIAAFRSSRLGELSAFFLLSALVLQAGLLRFLLIRKGLAFMLPSLFFCLLQNLCSGIAAVAALTIWVRQPHGLPRHSRIGFSRTEPKTNSSSIPTSAA